MPNPTSNSTAPRHVDHVVHDLYRAALETGGVDPPSMVRDDVRLDDSRPRAHDDTRERLEGAHHVLEGYERYEMAHTVAAALGVHGEITGAIGELAASPATTAAGMLLVAAHDFHEGDMDQATAQYDRMRGMLAALEGRTMDDPGVKSEAKRCSAFRAGLHDVQRLEVERPAMVATARAEVARARDDGYASVARGLDHGPAFRQRYHADLAFHHAVDHARHARTENGAAWGQIQAGVSRARASLEDAAGPVALRA